ncbi:choice-of-anchor I family protein [Pelagibacterium montanilacus]|uniref:choice-of-anchor I family protein n=1 Tax=Pelagibacterium montanilacus TaxID=2185280 RepID=UPI000F8DD8FE|nr:choice-of-anchor I family protein [Pelagibacterium montanilacus]
MNTRFFSAVLLAGVALPLAGASSSFAQFHELSASDAALGLSLLSRYETGVYDESAAEIVTYDPQTRRAYTVNAASGEVDVLDLADPANPTLINSISVSEIGAEANSIAVRNGIVAVAVQNPEATENGSVALLDSDGNIVSVVQAGALPDALTFSPDGNWVLVANEGEPREDFGIDPEGSITVIDVSDGAENVTQDNVRTANFQGFNGQEDDLRAAGVRIYGPGASAAQDFEPEWVEVSADNSTAYASLQENNAIAVIDIASATVTDVWPLGFKDWSEQGQWSGVGFDASRDTDSIEFHNWPVQGIFLPDTIRVMETGDETYIVTANEGDAREYDEDGWWSEEFEIRDLQLDTSVFPDAEELQQLEQIGRLGVTSTLGFGESCDPSLSTAEVQDLGYGELREYVHAECVYEELYVYGGRSFSIFQVTDEGLDLVFDSGSDFEEITAEASPDFFNADNGYRDVQFKRRSPNKGPEPEGVAVGTVDGRSYAFVGLERIGGVMVYDITTPSEASFVTYINSRDFTVGDDAVAQSQTERGAEGLYFVPAEQSPEADGRPLLIVGNEVSGTTAIYAIDLAD